MVQRAVLNHLIMAVPGDDTVVPAGWGRALVQTLESVLLATYNYDRDKSWDQSEVVRVQRLSPSVERWCTVFWALHAKFAPHMDMSSHLRAACTLRLWLGRVLKEVDGAAAAALEHEHAVLKMRQRLYPEGDHPDIAHSMNNLALTLYHLGQLGKSEALFASALAIYRRLLPPNHPRVTNCERGLAHVRSKAASVTPR